MAVVPFKRPISTQTTAAKQNTEATLVGMELDVADVLFNALQNSGIRNFFIDVELPMQKHLNELVGHVRPSNMDDWKTKLRLESDDQLRGIAAKSTKHDWSARPAYFHALLALIRERNISEKEADAKNKK